jgi:hypothetical protein
MGMHLSRVRSCMNTVMRDQFLRKKPVSLVRTALASGVVLQLGVFPLIG